MVTRAFSRPGLRRHAIIRRLRGARRSYCPGGPDGSGGGGGQALDAGGDEGAEARVLDQPAVTQGSAGPGVGAVAAYPVINRLPLV